MKDEIILSIDPGLTGGLSVFINGKLKTCIKMPVKTIITKEAIKVLNLDPITKQKRFYKTGPNQGKPMMKIKSPAKKKQTIDSELIYLYAQKKDMVIIEKQGCMPGNGNKQCETTMINYGRLFGAIESAGSPVTIVTASKWKKDLGLTISKEEKIDYNNDSKLIKEELKAMAYRNAKDTFPEHSGAFISERNKILDGPAESALIGWHYIQNK